MTALGISVHLESTLPVVTVVEALGPRAELQLRTVLVQPASAGDLARSLREVMAALQAFLTTGAPPSSVVVRSVNLVGKQRRTVLRTHHHVEGVLLAVSRINVSRVDALESKAIARLCGGTWAEVLASVAPFGTDPDASAAALAALILAKED